MTDTYSISRLLAWRGRAFDLSDECDWLDALDDFGPALLRFLLDGRHVAAIPESDGALAALKRSLVKAPLASLKPTRGSAWILFAFKDDLKGLPPPFRQDGVLLPFVWTREAQNGKTPRRLCELAVRVKDQLGAAADWQLVPAAYLGDNVDLDMPGATFDSAWGALACGLHLALNPAEPVAAWPFSSVAFDFAKGEPAAVGGLEPKLRVTAAFGADEIAVAPVQEKEARRTLAALRLLSPEDGGLKRLKICHWTWQGGVRKSVAALARCNRDNARRRFLRMVGASFATLTVLLLAAGAYWYDWSRERIVWYGDYVERRGVAEGLFPLKESVDGAYRFHMRGFDGWCPGCRRPVVREVWCVDAAGRVRRDRTDRPEHRLVAGRRYVYGESGRLAETHFLDADGTVLDTFRHSGRGGEVADVCGMDTNEVVRLGSVEFTAPTGRKGDSVRRIVWTRDANGFVASAAFQRDMSGGAAASGSGISRVEFTVDGMGRIVEERFRTADGAPAADGRGVHLKRYRYADAHLIEQVRETVDGRLRERITYQNGVRARLVVFLKSGGRDEHVYDEYGRIARVDYLSKDGKPEVDAAGVAFVRYEYDASGRQREILCGQDGRPINGKDGK